MGEEPPVCEHCKEILSVLHILFFCLGLLRRHFPESSEPHIPFHPALFLGEQPLVSRDLHLALVENIRILRKLYFSFILSVPFLVFSSLPTLAQYGRRSSHAARKQPPFS